MNAPHAPLSPLTTGSASLQHQWLPFTPNREFKSAPQMFGSAKDQYFYDLDGRPVLDAGSGLFTTPAGHCRAEIAEAVHAQLLSLDFSPSFLRAHPKSFELSTRIAQLLPQGIGKLFFVSSGSEAVDTAMKICLAYQRAVGAPGRTMFVSRERAYHGVNFGGVALSGMVNNRRAFSNIVHGVVHMRDTWLEENRYVTGQPEHGRELADDLLRLILLHGAENIAACVVEPIAGSTGVLVPPKGYLERLREICTAHGILLVFDEVICGFGRTGEAFASQSFGVTPDLITMAKAITNGAVPMAAVAVADHVHDAIVNSAPDGAIEFFHGYTWSAHPVASAAALAALDIYRDERLFERAQSLSGYFLEQIATLAELPIVTDIRGYGMLAGIDVQSDGKPGRRGHLLQRKLYDAGLHLKTTGDCAIVAPQFVFDREHIDQTVDVLRNTLLSFGA
ncbi:MAG: aminotransferase class III-fold pyridoxal phosphate-dependent enzyme [Paraburkholderia tropica]|uniref:Beta-alanine--pyruvate transaminase n=1 Tax=Paraburkholderia tropica TaxID=92647 RepID=A0ABX5MND3_9BURK|nr:aminotransferase class III-fold pyridoxal phosphate-dependent enzyme [Paraburkholderia tropica]MDE1144058.1 aminotransferase class III-fold pyridoxal phosphate-dependent enzyme [Paraburkholderia tropica]PXX11526.1 beta-alanine--pyruvate transaminase [Paraburkholderia tropica]PZW76189.1 beta-alanine--pyruvate transaminase [Paraburkholderia tropica]